jgi:hypothetical protein
MRRTVTESDDANSTLQFYSCECNAAGQIQVREVNKTEDEQDIEDLAAYDDFVLNVEDDNGNEDFAAFDGLVSSDFQSGGQEPFEENDITVERKKKKNIRQAKKKQKANDLQAIQKQRAKDRKALVRNKKQTVASAQSHPKSRPEVKSPADAAADQVGAATSKSRSNNKRSRPKSDSHPEVKSPADAAAFETDQVGAAKSKSRSNNKRSRPKSDSHPEVQPPADAVFNGMDSSTDEAETQDDLHQKTAATLCTAKSIFGLSSTDEDETPGDVGAAKSRSNNKKSRPKSDSHPEVQPPADAVFDVKVISSVQALQSPEQKMNLPSKKKLPSKKSALLQKQNMAIYDRTVDTMCEWLDDVYRKDTGSERGLGVFAARRIASDRPCAK